MRIMRYLAAAAIAAFALFTLSATPVEATPFDWTISSGAINGSGLLTTDGVQTVTSIAGTLNGDLITGLSLYAGADNFLLPPVVPAFPFVDFAGLSFSTATLGDWNVFWDGSGQWLLSSAQNPVGAPDGLHPINFNVTSPVPEPASIAMFGIGALGIGGAGALRRKKKSVATV